MLLELGVPRIVAIHGAIILLFAILSSPVFQGALAVFYAPSVQFSPPTLNVPHSNPLTEITSGQQLIISTTVSHTFGDRDLDMIALIEVRNSNGVTEYLAWQSGEVKVGGQMQIGVSWMPAHGGYYEFRTFAVTNDWDQPQVLSTVETSQIEIGHSCGGNAACITGTITNIVDGDTLDIGETRIRLALVDTPERGELGYHAAKEFTEQSCPVGSEAIIDEDDGQTEGSFGRTIGKVYCGNGAIVLNEELLRANMGEILAQFCNTSEFGDEPWAREYGCPTSSE